MSVAPVPPELAEALRWAENLAVRLCPHQNEREDVIQEARLGVLRAWERYDPARGVAFTTYAFPCAEGSVRHYLRDRRWAARLTDRRRDAAGNIAWEGLPPCLRPPLWLDQPLAGSEPAGSTRAELLAAADPLPEARVLALALLAPLDARLRRLLWLRFWLGWSQDEVGEEFELSQMQISRLEREALRELRAAWVATD